MNAPQPESPEAVGLSRIGGGEEVAWLRRIEVEAFRGADVRRRASPSWISASLVASLLVAVTVPGTAFAPASAHSRTDERAVFSLPAANLAADSFELRIEGDLAPIGGELRVLIEKASRERKAAQCCGANEVLRFGGVAVPRPIVDTILRAAEETGVDPVYMMALADKESSFSQGVKASTSSAEGLFQFVAKTWLQLVREYGPKYGLAAEAAAVELSGSQPQVPDPEMREKILDLRRDPYVSALMAGELLKRDRAAVGQRIGRELKSSEFYFAHFFGAASAARFLQLVGAKPKQSASRAFRAAAEANRRLFFSRHGRKTRGLTVAEVYGRIDRMIDSRLGRYRQVAQVAAAGGGDDASETRSPSF